MKRVAKGVYDSPSENRYLVRLQRKNEKVSKSFHYYENEESKANALREALAFITKERKSIETSGERAEFNIDVLTLGEIINAYEAEKVPLLKGGDREAYQVRYARNRASALLSLPIAQINEKHYLKIREQMKQEGYAPSSINKLLNVFSASYKHYRESKGVLSLVFPEFILLKVGKQISTTTDKALFEKILNEVKNKVSRLGILLLYYTGMRSSEAINLRWEYINWDEGIAVIPDSKNGEERTVFLNSVCIKELTALNPNRDKTGFVLTNKENPEVQLNKQTLTGAWCTARNHLLEKTESENEKRVIRSKNLHSLRHSFVTKLVNNKGVENILMLQQFTGHKDLRSLKRYYKQDPVKLKREQGHLLEDE